VPVSITATAGSASANAFVTLAELASYMEARLNSTLFDSATTDTKNRAIVEATREITVLAWEGSRTDTTQALSWPRTYAIDPDKPSPTLLGDIALLYFDTDEIPQRVKDATCELAFEFIRAGTSDVAAQDAKQNVIQKTIGPISTTYSEPFQRATGLARFPRVVSLLAPLLNRTSSGGLEMVRV
jgi:hypothetical protein